MVRSQICICVWLFTVFATGTTSADECSSEQGTAGQCKYKSSISTKRRLKWRVEIYTGKRPLNKIYGGAHVAEAFGKYFHGPVDGDDWHLLWTYRSMAGALQSGGLPPQEGRLVNHCGYFRAAGQKCILAEHISHVRDSIGKFGSNVSTSSFPRTYRVQEVEEFDQWMEAVVADPSRNWIAKPCAGGASKGIEILKGKEISITGGREWLGQTSVVQEFVDRPYLGLGGRKFHLRLYVLVARWWPSVSAFLYDEGVVFKSQHTYQHDNPSVSADVFSSLSKEVDGLPLSHLWRTLDLESARKDNPLTESPSSVVKHRIIAMLRHLLGRDVTRTFGDAKHLEHRGFKCFDLFGADVMINEDLHPVLLEVNMSPNLWIDDHGQEALPFLGSIKEPLVAQLSYWSALQLSKEPKTVDEASALDTEALVNFTRIS